MAETNRLVQSSSLLYPFYIKIIYKSFLDAFSFIYYAGKSVIIKLQVTEFTRSKRFIHTKCNAHEKHTKTKTQNRQTHKLCDKYIYYSMIYFLVSF